MAGQGAKPWLGVPEHMLTSGTAVMVAAGGGGTPRHRPALICYATVEGPADEPGLWWMNVHYGGTAAPLPQMFRTEEIVGVPALGLAPPTDYVQLGHPRGPCPHQETP